MILIIGNRIMRRRLEDVDFSDITSSRMVGEPYVADDNSGSVIITMDPEPTLEEAERIALRLTSLNNIEETLMLRARQALVLNNQWRQITNPTAAEAFSYLDSVSLELDALIRLVMRWLDTSD